MGEFILIMKIEIFENESVWRKKNIGNYFIHII